MISSCVKIWNAIANHWLVFNCLLKFEREKWNHRNYMWSSDKNTGIRNKHWQYWEMSSVLRVLFTKTVCFFFSLQIPLKNIVDSIICRHMKPFEFWWRILEQSPLICWLLYFSIYYMFVSIFPINIFAFRFTFAQTFFLKLFINYLKKRNTQAHEYGIRVVENNNGSNLFE